MKVLLIRPPHEHMIRTNVPKSVDTETGMYPPLGLLYVAAGLKAWSDAEVELLDAPALGLGQKGIGERIAVLKPDVVGIQAMTFTLIDAIATVRTAKSACPGAHVSLGGPHVNLYPEETLSIEGVDSLVLGEGERAFAEMVKVLGEGGEIADVLGVAVRRDGAVVTKGARDLESNLDALPQPARDLIDSSLYWSVLAKRNPVTTAMTSRGCPMKCIFCDRPHLGKTFRYRSARNVVDEMEDCVRRGIHEIFLYDDTFTIGRERIFDIRDEIKRRALEVQWDVRARANTLDAEVVKAMKEAGVSRMHIGVESGSERILKVMKKGITVEQAYAAFDLCRKYGVTSLSYFMLGNPTETQEDIDMTMDFIRKCRADYAHIAVTTPFPGTELYRMGLEQGVFERDYWREFAANPDEEFQPPAWTENFTQEELEQMRQRAYRVFYTRPSRLVRQVLAVRSFKEFWGKARVGLRLLLPG
jgi:anaerobic magnesium-protoporphyrin IX monomethyl ester cyclase